MKDLLLIICSERRSLFKGTMICFLMIFPFTFLPPILRKGFSLTTILERFNESTLYALGFALLIVIAAVIHNYNSLVEKKWIYEKSAFKCLDFYGRLNGMGSINRELETFLLGEIDGYFFRLGIQDPESEKPHLEIIPFIDRNDKKAEVRTLKKEHDFRQGFFFGKFIPLKKLDLEDPDCLRILLEEYSGIFKKLGFEPLDFELEEE
ncbi:hypothetical protein SAMN04488034_1104 [Salinimicrobium catena]|uniref:Uncharacterized protein n=1 Tax=Salinimicrobium catena TaxID=390640 RepID=A0A1H5P847_9FLAO|nr:hypothetical protein [Salinimicrobium catena]SDL75613.1 hypothetical protein SAMN04488140_11068 [Salinimicrobium catena]SEF09890.1 hypothetical protein SAMN04488034_1104 [Salinimicrobium catena]